MIICWSKGRSVGSVGAAVIFWLFAWLAWNVPAAGQHPVKPKVQTVQVHVERGADLVQPQEIWYQVGDARPIRLGILRVPRPSDSLGAPYWYDRRTGGDAGLGAATFLRDGRLAHLPLDDAVVDGRTSALLILRPPEEDAFDLAEPEGTTPLVQRPGVETVIELGGWFASVYGADALLHDRYRVYELRGRLRSTAPGGEAVPFLIGVRRSDPQQPHPEPIVHERVVYVPRESAPAVVHTVAPVSRLIVSVRTAAHAGPTRARLPDGQGERYEATRMTADFGVDLAWHPAPDRRVEIGFFGSSNPTFHDDFGGAYHQVPYGGHLAFRIGGRRGIETRLEGVLQDDPFQEQSFQRGDQRLRLLAGIHLDDGENDLGLRLGPSYLLDRPSVRESRAAARELGYALQASGRRIVPTGRFDAMVEARIHLDQSWGYVQDSGNRNTTLTAQVSLKPVMRYLGSRLALGPVLFVRHLDSRYANAPDVDEQSIQLGLELSTRLAF